MLQVELGQLSKWVWTTSQQGSTLRNLKQTNFEWGEETKNPIENTTSRGEKVLIGVPNNYSIIIDNPVHGKTHVRLHALRVKLG